MPRIGLVSIATFLSATLACDALQSVDNPVTFDTGIDNPGNKPGGKDTDVDSDTEPGGLGGANNPPRAAAGPDQTGLLPGTTMILDGTNSSDLDGDPLEYEWILTQKPPGSTTDVINFDFPEATLYFDLDGSYEVSLTVSDGIASNTDTVRYTVIEDNLPPIADAGFDQRVTKGATVQLSGAASYDPDDDALSYHWSFLSYPPGGGTPVLSGANIPSTAVSPSFIASAAGIYTLDLRVNDGLIDSQPDLVSITVTDPNTGGGSTGGGSSSSDCLDCAADAGGVASASWTAGGLASSFGLLGLPFMVVLWQRRRED